jgi:amino acid adenylation domain-containing protein/thioester reductase-like protein
MDSSGLTRLTAEEKRALLARLLRRRAGDANGSPLSHGQRALWFLHRLAPDSAAYNLHFSARIRSPLDPDVLRRSFDELAARHDSLRATFPERPDGPTVVVQDPEPVALPVYDATRATAEELDLRLHAEAHRPFDLTRGPVYRTALFRRADDDHYLILTIHHIVSDFWTLGVLMEELSTIYRAVRAGTPVPLPPPDRFYADFVAWQRDLLAGSEGGRLWDFWRENLKVPAGSSLPALNLPTDRPRPAVLSDRGATHRFRLDAELTAKLKDLARAEGTTLYAVLLAAYQAFLHRLTGQDDVLVGSPVACRDRPEFTSVIGYFVNMIVLRADASGRPTFRAFLRQVKQSVLDALAHQDFPFALLVERLQPARDLSRSPLFQAAFTLTRARRAVAGGDPGTSPGTNGHANSPLDLSGLSLEPIELEQRAAQFDWNWLVEESGDELDAALQYKTDLFDAATIERWMGHFRAFLRGLADTPDEQLARLPLLTAGERSHLLAQCQGPSVERPAVQLHRLIEEQVARAPEAVALVYEGESLTYAELNRRANRLARHLRTLGAGPDVPVALCVDRSLEMVIGLLATLKSGAAYAPLDPDLPAERLQLLLDDLSPPVVLTESHLADRHSGERRGVSPTCPPTLLRLDADSDIWAAESGENLANAPTASPDDVAYIIYTSGTTGQPKGCMNTHRGIVNRLLWMQDEYRLTAEDCVLQKTPYSFDVSVWEFFWPLLAGARLVIAKPGGHKDVDYLVRLIAHERVTAVHFVPSMLQIFLQSEGLHRCDRLRHVICSGEALSWDLQEQFGRAFGAALHNLYGPTEAAVDVTYWECRRTDPRKIVPIGRPISNTGIYILDAVLQFVPVGVPGELHIGGVNLARGYLNRPELTAEKFIPDPFHPGERLYKTGDLARYLPDGAVEYLGRLDHQVKVRGFRIELGEIESTLSLHTAVRESVVVARGDAAGQRLVAYIVPESDVPAPSTTELRGFLGGKLPDYMVPAAFVLLDALPLSPNGKVDRNALPAPATDRPDLDSEFVPPATHTERRLAAIWSEVLQVRRIGSRDSFFDLGGHSLLVTQVITRVKSEFGVELPLRRLFEATTLAEFAVAIDTTCSSVPAGNGRSMTPAVPSLADAPLRHVPRDEPLPMSFGQETLWFLDQLEPGNSSYNCPAAVKVRGPLDLGALRRAFELIVHRHESLRSTFRLQGERRVVIVNPPIDLPLEVTDLRGLPPDERKHQADALIDAEAARPFDLTSGPLLRLGVIRLADDESIVLMTVHHIAYDGWSTGVLVQEFATLYKAVIATRDRRKQPVLPPLAIQYPDFAYWQRQWQQDGLLDGQLAYWTKQLEGIPPLLDLPTDRPRPQVWSFRGAALPLRFPPELVAGLRALGRREGCTLFMTMLSAFQTLLHRWSGQDDICVGSPIANRNRVETERLIGFVVNTLVLRGNLRGDPTFVELMKRIRDVALGAYAHQDLPFERLMQALHPTRDVRHSSLFQVLFVLQNAPVQIPPLPGLTPKLLLDRHNGTAKFDLTLGLTEMPEGLVGVFEYNTDLFDRSTIERMAAQFRHLLEEVVRDPLRPISEMPLLADAERARLIAAGEAPTTTDGTDRRCIHHLFEARVAERPDAAALVMGEIRLSYAELNRRANRLAHYLRRRGVGPEVIVGIYAEKSIGAVVGLLAVLKAGSAYLPLDTALPRERLAVILGDASPVVVLTTSQLAADLPFDKNRVVEIDADSPAWADESDANPDGGADCSNLAYVIYTSGSTGTPKGCMIEHRGVVNAFEGWDAAYGLSELPTYLQMVNFAFDVFTGDLVRALGAGGTLVLCPTETLLDPSELLALLRREKIAYAEFVPAVVRPLLRHLEVTGQTMGPVRVVVCGSDVWYGGEYRRLRRVLPRGARLFNSYGLTEATIDNTYFEGDDDLTDDGSIPIGRPYVNQRLYVLDARLNPQPVGVPGELHVGGVCLARGYLNRPELTAEKFIPDPFRPGERLYKSGDLARLLPSGDIELLGRTDHQVKVRGFRIEPGEIEATLTKHPAVKDAAVAAHADGRSGKRLVAYLVLRDEAAAPSATNLRAFLGGKLPDYMVPAIYIPLPSLPLTPNGKVDRKALPAADGDRFALAAEYISPRTATEKRLAPLWAEILRVERVGSRDSFFDLGGHSLLATQVISRVRTEFGVELPLRKLFEASTLASFATVIDAAASGTGGTRTPERKSSIDWRAEATLDPAITAVGLAPLRTTEPEVILLTGATGFLGAFLLDELLRQTKSKIVCLARADTDADALARVRDNLARFHLRATSTADRIVPLAGDLSRPRFGLGDARFAQLAATVDAIYHNGAHVNFLHPYENLKAANVLGTQEVLRLATTSRLKPVHFISTLSVLPHLNSGKPALETDRNNQPELLENGYAQSKWVAEQLVWAASERGVPVSILRPGRIVWHSRTGALSPDDLFTRALRACIALGSVPDMDAVLEMTPVDYVARATVQIGRTPSARGRAYHLFNRRYVRLGQLVEWVRAAGYPLDVLPVAQWLTRVQENATTDARDALAGLLPLLANGMPKMPGDAVSGGPNVDDRQTQAALSGTGVEPPAINAESVAGFLARLAADGLLAPPPAAPSRRNGHGPHHTARDHALGAK